MMTLLVSSLSFHFLAIVVIVAAFEDNHVVREFKNIQHDFGKWKLSLHPVYATTKEVYDFNDKLESLDPDEFDRMKSMAEVFAGRLQRLPYEKMPNETQVDYDILKHTLQTFLGGYKWRLYGPMNSVSILDGPVRLPRTVVEHAPLSTKGDFVDFYERVQAFPRMIDQHKENLKKAVLYNRTHHRVSMLKVKDQFKEILTSKPEHFILYQPYNDTIDGIETVSSKERKGYRTGVKAWIKKTIDAYKNLFLYIEQTYMRHLRTGLGVCTWENGREFYRAALKWHLTTDITPRQVNDIGIREVKRIKEKMTEVLRRIGFKGTIREFTTSIKGDPNYTVSSTHSILNLYRDIIKDKIVPALPRLFKVIPKLPIRVAPSRSDGIFAGYEAGSKDGLQSAVFYVNLFRPTDVSIPDFIPIALHETLPGYHLQRSSQAVARLPLFRKHSKGSFKYYRVPFDFPDYNVFAEGWALYAEALGETMELYKDDYYLLGRYSSELFRACLLVVDTGIHYYSWSRDRAVDYLLTHSTFGLDLLENIVDRIVTWPGQACGAKIGELKIWELRRRAERKLDWKFDIREFHAELLRHGDVPLQALEKIVDIWINKTANSTVCGSASSLQYWGPFKLLITVIILFIIV
ncbi:uncharacterized protein LOC110448052 [Mizuhopecten yessoensis]|uniref:Uncharacterized protein n=1 Tax=Mizuhopecten yessoensis TaxID=6573 RepID=A0A210QTZ0_MIZYE|nr:uncharacterized protein LOC110448052 [Mizuhopecten yessoensis]OWF52195.1 hypothetical protein KP79_PYT20094 [Mizuhopecten yessoensis]